MKKFSTLFLALFLVCATFAQQPPKREVRSVWLTTAWALDWPSVRVPAPIIENGVTVNEAEREAARNIQKNTLFDILERLDDANINTIYFQVRPMNDAFYRSNLPGEAWSQWLSSERGADPGWSPLGFLIEHAHPRGIEVHAWLNPYRYSSSTATLGRLPTDILTTHPHWLLDYTGISNRVDFKILNPGMPEVKQYIADVIEDIIRNYNVDGIVLDDYFYQSGTTDAMDQAQFDAYNPNNLSREDWRRENVNEMIRIAQERINSISPWIQWGVSPAGVAVGGVEAVAAYYGVPVSPGHDWQRDDISSSPVAWLRDGTIDYISPQIYWRRGHPTNPYGEITAWWAQVSNQFGRHFFSSHTKSMSGVSADDMPNELIAQIQINRDVDMSGTPGVVFFRTMNRGVSQATYNLLRDGLFRFPALTAIYGWKPAPMQGLVTNLNVSGQNVTWNYTPNGDFDVRFAIYAVPNANRNDANVLASPKFLQGVSYTTSFVLRGGISPATHRIAVAVYDRFGNLFPARVLGESLTTIEPAQLIFPTNNRGDMNTTPIFAWEANGADFYVWQIAKDANFTQPIASRETTSPSFNLALQSNIRENTAYYWRVKSVRANAPVSISEVRAFYLAEAPTKLPTATATPAEKIPAEVDTPPRNRRWRR